MSIPDILKQVLADLDVSFQIQGTFQPREYCVQYRESDFQFASRLMEEEGIYYYFQHTASGHTMVVANTPGSHADVPGPTPITFETVAGGTRREARITAWKKRQEVRSGKYTLWDHCFELPGKNLEAIRGSPQSVQVGTVSHSLSVANNGNLEIYEFPGDYAKRFDGIGGGGGEQAANLQKIFTDDARTAGIRMQEEAARGDDRWPEPLPAPRRGAQVSAPGPLQCRWTLCADQSEPPRRTEGLLHDRRGSPL